MPDPSALRPAVYLDRDGTIAEEIGDLNHVSRFRMFPFVPAAIRRLNEEGMPVVVITNQSDVGRRHSPESLVFSIHEILKQNLAAAGPELAAIYFCPHTPDGGCASRKPKTGLLDAVVREHSLDLSHSFVVGDHYSDVELARRACLRSTLVWTGYGEGDVLWHSAKWPAAPDFIAADLTNPVYRILRQPK